MAGVPSDISDGVVVFKASRFIQAWRGRAEAQPLEYAALLAETLC